MERVRKDGGGSVRRQGTNEAKIMEVFIRVAGSLSYK